MCAAKYCIKVVYSHPSTQTLSEESEDAIMDKEMKVLCGVIDHLLPKVGSHVHTLDLAYGKAVSNEVVRLVQIMYRCEHGYTHADYTCIAHTHTHSRCFVCCDSVLT